MIKWFGRIILIGVIVFIAIGVYAYFDLKSKEPPSIETAHYALQDYYSDNTTNMQIPTRYYYAENIELVNGKAVLTNYWTFDGKRYKRHEGEKPVDPPFDIIRRLD